MGRSLAQLVVGLLALGAGTAVLPALGDIEAGELGHHSGKFLRDLFLSPASDGHVRAARASNGQTDFNAFAVKKILAKHNNFRAAVSPGASNMKYMTWDANLATMAQRWADRCRFDHGQTSNPSSFDPVGQNIFARGGQPNKQPPASDFVPYWHAEVEGYQYNSNGCSGRECGHYKQVVWADTYKVGCGLKFCSRIGDERNAWFVVCNYGPSGNFYGEKPYKSGELCSQCPDDKPFCFQGLCDRCSPQSSSECICAKGCKNCGSLDRNRCECNCPNGFLGADCGEVCRDTHEYCHRNPGWPDETFCDFDPMVPVGCPLMCGVCQSRDRNYSCANPNGSGGGSRPVPRGGGAVKLKKTKKKKKKGKKNKKKGRGKKKKGRRPNKATAREPNRWQ